MTKEQIKMARQYIAKTFVAKKVQTVRTEAAIAGARIYNNNPKTGSWVLWKHPVPIERGHEVIEYTLYPLNKFQQFYPGVL